MLPEIVLFAKFEYSLRRNIHLLIPDFIGLIVIYIDRWIEPVSRDTNCLCKEFPSPRNSLLLKIISKGEVSKHLKKGTMSCCLTYIVYISCTYTLLTGTDPFRRWNLLSRKIRLKRCHTGVYNKQAVIIMWYK